MFSLRALIRCVLIFPADFNLFYKLCEEEIAELAKSVCQLSITPEPEVIISSLIFRSDDSRLGKQINEVNSILSKLCGQHHWKFIDHSNITQKHLNRTRLAFLHAKTLVRHS